MALVKLAFIKQINRHSY